MNSFLVTAWNNLLNSQSNYCLFVVGYFQVLKLVNAMSLLPVSVLLLICTLNYPSLSCTLLRELDINLQVLVQMIVLQKALKYVPST